MEEKKPNVYTRRHFLQNIIYGGAGVVILGSFGFRIIKDDKEQVIKAIWVDFDKCTGCRTCEAVCSASNHRDEINGKKVSGLGNPFLSNIKVHHFNPDVDIPVTCAICPDTPCIKACPVSPDLETGRKALYRDKELHTIKNDKDRCLGCSECAKACKNYRAGVIYPNEKTGKPERICTLCYGNPQCVKYCPYDALEYKEMPLDRDLKNLAPEKIAQRLIKKYYNIEITEAEL
ncbi:MAG: 4Fe-4S dicluster domain-containing protein [Bacteroidales bacterium]